MARDPRHDPQEGDELRDVDSDQIALVDLVRGGEVYYRIVTADGALVAAYRQRIGLWRLVAGRARVRV